MVLIYWKYEINKLVQFAVIYKNLRWLHLWYSKFTPFEDEIYPRLGTTSLNEQNYTCFTGLFALRHDRLDLFEKLQDQWPDHVPLYLAKLHFLDGSKVCFSFHVSSLRHLSL